MVGSTLDTALMARRRPMRFRLLSTSAHIACISTKLLWESSRDSSMRPRTSWAIPSTSLLTASKLLFTVLARLVAFNMSLLIALPCIRINPVQNSSVDTWPSPSSRISKTSGNSSNSMSNVLSWWMNTISSRTFSANSCLLSMPLSSVSSSSNISSKACSWRLRSFSFICATASSSSDAASKAFFTTIAVMRLNRTKPAIPTKSKNTGMVSGILKMIGRTMLAQLSKVMIWKRVYIAFCRSPNISCVVSSS
mmetsp:Transcript_93515/g.243582  ORF Transcript_93515/g.243582 Transcript_93515/m.243582 type:complete len:251 (-) Transcript_93515:418-1170(-)